MKKMAPLPLKYSLVQCMVGRPINSRPTIYNGRADHPKQSARPAIMVGPKGGGKGRATISDGRADHYDRADYHGRSSLFKTAEIFSNCFF